MPLEHLAVYSLPQFVVNAYGGLKVIQFVKEAKDTYSVMGGTGRTIQVKASSAAKARFEIARLVKADLEKKGYVGPKMLPPVRQKEPYKRPPPRPGFHGDFFTIDLKNDPAAEAALWAYAASCAPSNPNLSRLVIRRIYSMRGVGKDGHELP